MKKLFLSILIIILYINSNAQSPLRINKYLIDSLTGSGYWYLYHDSTHTGQWGLVAGSGGGGGGGVSSITQAYGIINTPNPITSTGTIKFDSATVFPQLRATIKQRFGVSGEDDILGQDRTINFRGLYSMEFDSVPYFAMEGKSGSYIHSELQTNNPYFESILQSSTGFYGSDSWGADATSSHWGATSSGGNGNQYLSVQSTSYAQNLQLAGYHNVAGRWIDNKYEANVSATLTSESHIYQHLEQWNGSATQRFTNVRYWMDSTGFRLQTYRKAGVNDNSLYKGILIDTSSNVRFENYPSSRNDGTTQKVLYIGNSSGDIKYGYLDTTFYATQYDISGFLSSAVTSVAAGFGTSFTTITSTGSVIVDTTSGGVLSWVRGKKIIDSLSAASGGGTPAGSDREIQINNSGAFGTATWKINSSSELLNLSDQGAFKIQIDGDYWQQGATSDGSTPIAQWHAANGGNRMYLWSDGHLRFGTNVNSGSEVIKIDDIRPIAVYNSSANSYSVLGVQNDQLSTSRSVELVYTGSTYASNYLTSGPTGEQGVLYTSGSYPLVIGTNNTQRMLISNAGVVTINDLAGTGSRNVLADANGVLSAPVSDFSVKKNIRSLEYGLSTIMKLNPVSFEYKDGWKSYGQGKQIGFIAQDIKEVLPNSAFITPTTGKMGYNEIDLVPVLVKAVQEQQEQINELKKEIKKLKRK